MNHPINVKKCYSIDVFFDKIPEAIRDPAITIDKFVFISTLAAHMAEKYPMQRPFLILQDHVVPAIRKWAHPIISSASDDDILMSLTVKRSAEGLERVVRVFVIICYAFQTLLDTSVQFLSGKLSLIHIVL